MGLFKNIANKLTAWNQRNRNKVTQFFDSIPTKAAGLYKKAVLDPQKQMNLELADHTYAKNLEMWNLQNAYNDPSSQRARMEAAGFNPNTFAGGGSGATGNAGSLPPYNVQAPQVDPVGFYQRMIGAANGLLNLRMGVANIRKTESQTGKLGIEEEFLRDTKAQRKRSIIAKNEKTYGDIALGDQLLQFRGGGTPVGTNRIHPSGMFSKQRTALDQQIENQRADLVFKQYRNELAKYGIYSSDNFMFRMGIQALDTIGLDPSSWLKSGSEGLSRHLNAKR